MIILSKGTAGSFFGNAIAGVDLIPIFRQNELKKHPDSFLKTSALIIKKIAIAAPAGSVFQLNGADFLMPANAFELSYGTVDIKELIFKQDTPVTITYIY